MGDWSGGELCSEAVISLRTIRLPSRASAGLPDNFVGLDIIIN